MLARELGRLASESGLRLGSGPKDRRLIPDVLSLGTWLGLGVAAMLGLVGVVSSPATEDEAVDPTVRFRERIVIEEGTDVVLELKSVRGDARGGVCVGAGSFERADCTRASSRCICAVSVLMCDSELDEGSLCVPGRTLRLAGVRNGAPPVEGSPPDGRAAVGT